MNHLTKPQNQLKSNADNENAHVVRIITNVSSDLSTPKIPLTEIPNQSINQSASDENSSNECSTRQNDQQLLESLEDKQVINNCDLITPNEHLIFYNSNNTDSNSDSVAVTATNNHFNDKELVKIDKADVVEVDAHENNDSANENITDLREEEEEEEKQLIEYQKQSKMSSTKHVNNKIKCNNETNHSDKDNNEEKEFQRASKVNFQ